MDVQYTIAGVFPVPILKIKFNHHHKYRFPTIEKRDNKPEGWIMSLNTSYPNIEKNNDFINEKTTSELKSDIKNSIDEVFNKLNITTEYFFNEFWYNIYHKNQGQEIHNHLGVVNPYWCGIYYNKNSTPTVFIKEGGIHDIHLPAADWHDSKLNLFFAKNNTLSVIDGSILLFPPYLKHFVPEQETIDSDNKMRLTFSFNLFLNLKLDKYKGDINMALENSPKGFLY